MGPGRMQVQKPDFDKLLVQSGFTAVSCKHYKAALVLALFIAGDSPEQLHTRAEGAFPVRQSHQRIDS